MDTLGREFRPLLDSKAVLLVYDDKTQTVKAHRLLKEGVGSDHHLQLPHGDSLPESLPLSHSRPPAEQANSNPHGSQKGLGLQAVLFRQDLGWGHDRPLKSAPHRVNHGEERHSGLPASHIPLQEASHGPGPGHVGLDLL